MVEYSIEQEKKVWESIAPIWHKVRKRPFPHSVERLAEQWKPGRILDVGCGNGRNMIPFAKRGFTCIGLDISENLIRTAQTWLAEQGVKPSLVIGSAPVLPFKQQSFDYLISGAMFHHFPPELHRTVLAEFYNVLKPNGKMLLSVFNKWQKRFFFGPKERYVPWKFGLEQPTERYFYFFTLPELKRLVRKAGFEIEEARGWFGKHTELVLRKPK